MRDNAIIRFLGRGVRQNETLTLHASLWALLLLGSTLMLETGFIHLRLYDTGYRSLPIIGPLFILQSASAVALALGILAVHRVFAPAIGAMFMAASAGGLLVSLTGRLFGFHESLGAPYAGLTLGLASAGVVVLAAAAVLMARRGAPRQPAR